MCDGDAACAGEACVDYAADGDDARAPFCSATCEPDPACDPLDPIGCASTGGDFNAGCPRDADHNRGVCVVLESPVGAGATCAVTSGGLTIQARCGCVPCCAVDPTLCRHPLACP